MIDFRALQARPRRRVDSRRPDPEQIAVRMALAQRHGVPIDNIVCGSGSDDILDFLIRLVGPTAIVISSPTFGMYKYAGPRSAAVPQRLQVPCEYCRCADRGRAASRRLHCRHCRRQAGHPEARRLLDSFRSTRSCSQQARILFLPSPNNPTGTPLTNADIESLLEEVPRVVRISACDRRAEGLPGGDRRGVRGVQRQHRAGPVWQVRQPGRHAHVQQVVGLVACRAAALTTPGPGWPGCASVTPSPTT